MIVVDFEVSSVFKLFSRIKEAYVSSTKLIFGKKTTPNI